MQETGKGVEKAQAANFDRCSKAERVANGRQEGVDTAGNVMVCVQVGPGGEEIKSVHLKAGGELRMKRDWGSQVNLSFPRS